MKVTVSFGDTKVVVPCGDGNMPVRDLVDKAINRYRKSTTAAMAAGLLPGGGSGLPDNVELPNIDHVKLARDNGILDWDDRVADVLDDREMIVACLAPADPPNNLPPLPADQERVPPLHGNVGGGDSLGSASSPEFHTAPASAALSAITARVRQGGDGSGGGDAATGSLTTLGDTCSPGGSTASSSAPGHDPPGHHHPHGHHPAPGHGHAAGHHAAPTLQHNLGCPAAAGGSEPHLGPAAGLSRIVCCRRAYAGSSIAVSGPGAADSPPSATRAANNGLLAHRHQRHRGSLDSCAITAPGGERNAVQASAGQPEPQKASAATGDHVHRHQHPFQPALAPHPAPFVSNKREPVESSSATGAPGRSPVMVAIDSNSSSDHDEDYPRLRREPLGRQSLGNNPSLLRWLDAQERLQHGTPGDDPPNAATQPLSLRIEPRSDGGAVEPAPGSSLLKTALPKSTGGSAAAKEAEAMGLALDVYRSTIVLKLRNEGSEQGGGLGIQVKPYYSPSPGPGLSNRIEAGLEIQRVVPGGRMAREGKLRAGDRIIEINNFSLNSVSFVRAQEMFRQAMRTAEIALRVIPAEPVQSPPGGAKSVPPPLLPKPTVSSPPRDLPPINSGVNREIGKRPAPLPPGDPADDDEEDPWAEEPTGADERPSQRDLAQLAAAAAAVAAAKKAPPPPQRSPMTHLSAGTRNGSGSRELLKRDDDDCEPGRTVDDAHAISSSSPSSAGGGGKPGQSGHMRKGSLGGSKKDLVNTKRPGVRHVIVLTKGKDGFGFSLTTRDTKTNGPNPILVKSILNRGAALRDGRLQRGDRMLEVDGLDVTERTQKEVVQMLKSVAVGTNVRLTISRQEEDDEDEGEGVENGGHHATYKGDESSRGRGNHLSSEGNQANYRVVNMEFDISLEDTELNGLGISVKGLSRESPSRGDERDSSADGRDEGVYVKNVIPGGAAFKDGRLEVNDQILEINGTSLRALSNKQALARLRSAVQRGSKETSGHGSNSPSHLAGCIRVVIARRQALKAAPGSSSTTVNSGDSSNHSMLISAEVHQQQQSAAQAAASSTSRASKQQRLARQPTRQQRIEDEEVAGFDDDDTPPLPPPPPVEDMDVVSAAGLSTGPGDVASSTLEHPVLSRLRRQGPHACPHTLMHTLGGAASWQQQQQSPPPLTCQHCLSTCTTALPRHDRVMVESQTTDERVEANCVVGPCTPPHGAVPLPTPVSQPAVPTTRLVPLLDLTAAGQQRRRLPTPPAASSPREQRRTATRAEPEETAKPLSAHRRSVSAELIGQATTYLSEEEDELDSSLYFSREGLGRRSMSEKRHAMEAAQQFAFYQEWSAKRQEGKGQEDVSQPPLASSEQLLQRCQRLMGHRHPSTDSLGSQPLRASLPAVSGHKKGGRPMGQEAAPSRQGPLKAVAPSVEKDEASADAASLLSTASTTALQPRHARHRRQRPISFRRAVDRSLGEPDDQEQAVSRPSRGRLRELEPTPPPPPPPPPADDPNRRQHSFWRALWPKRKRRESSPNHQPTTAAVPSAVQARVMAWQRRNDAALRAGRRRDSLPSASSEVAGEAGALMPNNRTFSVYIPATSSLCYADDEKEEESVFRVAVTSR